MPHASPTWGRRSLLPAVVTVVLIVAALAVAGRFAPWELTAGNLVLRSQRGADLAFPTPASGVLVAIERPEAPAAEAVTAPRNVILMIGDGMGLGPVSTASAALHGPIGRLVMESAPVTGLVKTASGDRLTTDSAASSTAMATGFKVPNRVISLLDDGRRPVTLFESARSAGLASGVVTTCGLFDATPAGFTAHAGSREQYDVILDAMLTSGADVLIGGDGSGKPKALRNEGLQRRLGDLDALGSAAGYSVVRSSDELAEAEGPVLAMYPPRSPGSNAHGPPLADSAMAAIRRLETMDRGFVLLVECEMVDDSGHLNDAAGVVEAIRELDAAVAAVLAWAEPRRDTLVLVTADHDTGGLGIVAGDYGGGAAEVRWLSVYHTAQWVPLFAFGPGAEAFGGVIDNTEIGVRVAELLALPSLPSVQP